MIDWARIAELQQDIGAEDFAEVTALFLEEVERVLGTLSDTAPPEALAEHFHFLKGSALNIGFRRLAEVCTLAEHVAASGQPCAAPIARLRKVYADSKALLLSPEGRRALAG